MRSLAVDVLSILVAAQAEAEERPSAADEGLKVIKGMLIVGLIFVAVIALGQASKWLSHRRHERRPRAY